MKVRGWELGLELETESWAGRQEDEPIEVMERRSRSIGRSRWSWSIEGAR